MGNIQVLDCTLRDGGYCNDCNFGFENIHKIVNGLKNANIGIVECGFFNEKIDYDKNKTRFSRLDQITEFIPENRDDRVYVALADHGKFAPEDLPEYDGKTVDGIRVAFHKKDLKAGINDCKIVKSKGYKTFVQPMVSVSYSDDEFLELIRQVNEFKPHAFYIVDSFGMMKEKDLTRFFYMVEHNLEKGIKIGLHSHNNMQLAYSNAQKLVQFQTNRDIIIDSSVYGMGRGAGNLNTELFVEYLNENGKGNYQLQPLLNIIDEILNDFYQQNYWGYSLPNYLSAKNNLHPNYASYLDDKKTLTVNDMNEIFKLMDEDKKFTYDKKYIEELYLSYMKAGSIQEVHQSEFNNLIKDKKVLLIAPGKSSSEEKDKICDFASSEDVVTISVNCEYMFKPADYIFVSNIRRFKELSKSDLKKCIITSNISATDVYLRINYSDLLNDIEMVKDNAGLMLLKLLIENDVKDIYLAGFDGYSHDLSENYANNKMTFILKNVVLDSMNEGMKKYIKMCSEKTNIHFLTKEKYITL